MDRQQIQRYSAGADVPAGAIEGLTKDDLLATPVPGTWSIQQIVLHLMDGDLIGSDRMKRVAAEHRPTLLCFDESAFASKLGYEHLDAVLAAEVFRLNRQLTAQVLRRLPDDAFKRIGLHNERGKETLDEMVRYFADHVDHHMKFIRRKRELLGKPL